MYGFERHAMKYSISSSKQDIKVLNGKKKAQNLNPNTNKCAN